MDLRDEMIAALERTALRKQRWLPRADAEAYADAAIDLIARWTADLPKGKPTDD